MTVSAGRGVVAGEVAWPAWMNAEDRACKGRTDEMFPQNPGPDGMLATRHARAICDTCPYLVPCSVFAVGPLARRLIPHGVLGGMSPEQRKTARRHLRVVA